MCWRFIYLSFNSIPSKCIKVFISEDFCIITSLLFCSRYIIELTIYDQIVPRIGDSVLLGFEEVPVKQKFYKGHDFVYVW